ncbi:hypothetical protein R6Q59_014851 [Mikania micrantha]
MEIENMVRVLSLHPLNTHVNLSKMLLAMVKEVVCKVGFGKNYIEEPVKGISWEEILDEAVVMLDGSYSDNFPWLGRIFDMITGWNRKLEKCFGNLDAYIQMILDDHNNDAIADISEDDKDFVHRLIELSSMADASHNELTKEDVKALIMNVDVDSVGGGGNFEMLPFGGGRRSCPAINTAPATVELVIANLLYWFDWGLPDGLKIEDLDMEEEGSLIIHKKLPLCLVPIKRNWED